MFTRVMQLIYATSGKSVGNRSAEEVQEDTLHQLKTLRRFRTQPHMDGLVDPAIRFVSSEAWSLLYQRIRHVNGWKGGQIASQALDNLDKSLEEHFLPIQEEYELCLKP